jgi:hypothetical protein
MAAAYAMARIAKSRLATSMRAKSRRNRIVRNENSIILYCWVLRTAILILSIILMKIIISREIQDYQNEMKNSRHYPKHYCHPGSLSPLGSWSECTLPCHRGVHQRSRTVLPAYAGGESCPASKISFVEPCEPSTEDMDKCEVLKEKTEHRNISDTTANNTESEEEAKQAAKKAKHASELAAKQGKKNLEKVAKKQNNAADTAEEEAAKEANASLAAAKADAEGSSGSSGGGSGSSSESSDSSADDADLPFCEPFTEWGEWSACSVTCGSGGQNSRTRKIDYASLNLGKPESDEPKSSSVASELGSLFRRQLLLREKSFESRNLKSTPAPKFGPVKNHKHCRPLTSLIHANTDSSGDHADGSDENIFTATAHSIFLAPTSESSMHALQEVASCESDAECGCQDCEWGEWGVFGACTCMGLQERHRSIAKYNNECGKPCSGPKAEAKSCTPQCDVEVRGIMGKVLVRLCLLY